MFSGTLSVISSVCVKRIDDHECRVTGLEPVCGTGGPVSLPTLLPPPSHVWWSESVSQ